MMPTVRTANDLPDFRLALLNLWRKGGLFHHAAVSGAIALLDPPPTTAAFQTYAEWEETQLRQASLWWVSAPMVDLLMAAVASIPEDTRVQDLPSPSPSGLVVFEKPWWGVSSTSGKEVSVSAILWGSTRLPPSPTAKDHPALCLSVSSYFHRDARFGLSPDELGTAASTGALSLARERRIGEVEDGPHKGAPTFALEGDIWAPLGRSDWPLEDTLGQTLSERIDPVAMTSMIEDRRVIAALWSMVAQEAVAETETRPAARQARRRGERAGVTNDSKVRIVTLRRRHRSTPHEDSESRAVDWSHRWFVNGYWRWQPVGPGRQERRLTWVRPHVKGPEDKELQVKDEVRAWVR